MLKTPLDVRAFRGVFSFYGDSMIKLLAIVLISLSLFFISTTKTNAQISEYTFAYNLTNFYSTQTLIYDFANLDASHLYFFRVEFYDIETNNFRGLHQLWIAGEGSTTARRLAFNWPLFEYNAVRVVDEFGNVLGRHFIAPLPLASNSWADSEAHAGRFLKTSIGNLPQISTNSGLLHIDNLPQEVTTQLGDFILVHYRADFESSPLNQTLRITRIGGGITINLDMDAIIASNTHPDFDWGIEFPDGITNFFSFILLSTDCNFVKFPFSLCLTIEDLGVYEYARLDDMEAVLSNGESVWIINDTLFNEFECEVLRTRLPLSGTQRVRVTNRTQEVFNSYNNQRIIDGLSGTVGQAILSDFWGVNRNFIYEVANFESVSDATYRVSSSHDFGFPFELNFEDYRFNIFCGNYTITASVENTLWGAIERVLPENDPTTVLLGLIAISGVFAVILFKLGLPMKLLALIMIVLLIAGMLLGLFPAWVNVLAVGLILLLTAFIIFTDRS